MNALVFSTDGTLYSAGGNGRLYTVDTTSGVASLVGAIGFASSGDLAFDQFGQLYMSSEDDTLVKIDESTGQGMEIGPFGFNDVLGMARDENDVMYGYSFTDILTIDLVTGQGTLFFDYGGSWLTKAFGGSFRQEAFIPEPSAGSLGAIGLWCLATLTYRRSA
jgi:hypothetical protein